jgi:hypothetical protein
VSNPFLDDGPDTASVLSNVAWITTILQQAAREGRAMSYSEMLMTLGFRFTRPKMRALCKTLDAIDIQGGENGEPALACLIVREGDGLPGQGWWVGRQDYSGPWDGPKARSYLKRHQQKAFAYWQGR